VSPQLTLVSHALSPHVQPAAIVLAEKRAAHRLLESRAARGELVLKPRS